MSFSDDPSSQSQFVPLVLVALGVLLIFGALAWFFFMAAPAVAPQPPPVALQPMAPAQAAAGQPVATLRIPYPTIHRISARDAKAAHDLGSAVFIDVRSQQSYDAGHIPGAILMTEEELPERLSELKKSDWIITYCT